MISAGMEPDKRFLHGGHGIDSARTRESGSDKKD